MKTAIFVDVQNIYYTTRDTFQRSFNYKRFWNQIESNNEIIIAKASLKEIKLNNLSIVFEDLSLINN